MERGSPIFSHNHLKKSNSGNTKSPPLYVGAKIEKQPLEPHNMVVAQDEEEECIPITHLLQIMQRVLPSDAEVSQDSMEAMQALVYEFITFITSEANDWSQDNSRVIIRGEDVLWAMKFLGFTDYVGPLVIYLQRYRNKIYGSGAGGSKNSQH